MRSKVLPTWSLSQCAVTSIFFIVWSFVFSTAQSQSITGVVRSATDNQPMTGATVQIKGKQVSTATDAKGHYVINGNPSDSLMFSSIGFRTESVLIKGRKEVNIILQAEASSLDQVVVIGYGTQRKSDLTGSVVRVSMDDKSVMANTNIFSALSGATAGVNVQSLGGAGSEPNLGIRGQTSLSASDQPLIVLDGIIYNGSVNDINVNDVESVDILKDASAAAVFGSRSANGVILITTKRGKSEKPSVSFNAYRGFQGMTNNPMKVMNAEQYAIRLVDYYYQQDLYTWYKTKPTSTAGRPVRPDITNRSIVAGRLRSQEEKDNYLAGNSINWVDEVMQQATLQNYSLSFSGRSDRTTYFVSGSYSGEDGILKNDKFKRLTVRTNLESKVNSWFTVGLNSSYSYRDYSGLEASLGAARSASPLANNKIGFAKYDMYLTGEIYMPYPLNNLYVENSDTRNSLFLVGTAKVTVPWVKGLTYDFNYSNTYNTRDNNTFYPVTTPQGSTNKGLAVKQPSQNRNWIINNIVSYQTKIGEHRINATLLYSRENRTAQSSSLNAQGFDNPVLGYNNVALGTIATVASGASESNGLSSMARGSYSFKDRYLVTGTVRRDGFSGFGPNRKFATFPSVSIGWVASEESFLKEVKGLYLKMRASYGKNGNQGIGSYSSFSRMGTDAYVFGSATASAIFPSSIGNANLGWETTSSVNLGFDFGIINKRISGSIDLYNAKTTNVLVNRALPPASGYSSVWTNIGGIDNKGIELSLSTINFKGKVGWKSDFVFSMNRDKITKLYGGENDKDLGNGWFVGQPITAIYDYKMAGGVYTENELFKGTILNKWYPGQFRYVDLNTDGIIDPNNDRSIIGYETPSYRFSIGNTITYKNLSLFFLFNSIQGGDNYYLANNANQINASSAPPGQESAGIIRTNLTAVRPYWTPDNGVSNASGIYYAPEVFSGIYQSRSFVRLQDVSLMYKFGSATLKTIGIDGFQVYISGKNVHTWTNWSGWDPEIGVSNFPLMRNIIGGLRVSF